MLTNAFHSFHCELLHFEFLKSLKLNCEACLKITSKKSLFFFKRLLRFGNFLSMLSDSQYDYNHHSLTVNVFLIFFFFPYKIYICLIYLSHVCTHRQIKVLYNPIEKKWNFLIIKPIKIIRNSHLRSSSFQFWICFAVIVAQFWMQSCEKLKIIESCCKITWSFLNLKFKNFPSNLFEL